MKKVFAFAICALAAQSSFALGINVNMESSRYVVENAAQSSCVATANGQSQDVQPLSLNLGKLKLSWLTLSPEKLLKIEAIEIELAGRGLAEEQVVAITGQELACIMTGDPNGSTVLDAKQTTFHFNYDVLVGGLKPWDNTLRASFRGNGKVKVYGVVQAPGRPDLKVSGSDLFRFAFPGSK